MPAATLASRLIASLSICLVSAAVQAAPAAAAASEGLATWRVAPTPVPSERMLDGTVEAVNQATISAQTAGRIAAIEHDVNDTVAAGALLVRIRAAEQVAGLGQAQAALREATAREAEAQANFRRIEDMYQRKVVARATYDDAKAAQESAVARLEAARAAVDSAREGVAYTEIRAPYAGVVTAKLVQVGESVAPGMPLVAVAALGALRVVADVPQAEIERVRAARSAAVYADGRRIVAGGLTLYPVAQPGSSTFRVRIDLPADVQGLAPGMYVKVALATGESETILVPRSAVIERSELRSVYVVRPDGRVVLRQVRLGRTRDDKVEVLAGLVAGDVIALDPAVAAMRARQAAHSHD